MATSRKLTYPSGPVFQSPIHNEREFKSCFGLSYCSTVKRSRRFTCTGTINNNDSEEDERRNKMCTYKIIRANALIINKHTNYALNLSSFHSITQGTGVIQLLDIYTWTMYHT